MSKFNFSSHGQAIIFVFGMLIAIYFFLSFEPKYIVVSELDIGNNSIFSSEEIKYIPGIKPLPDKRNVIESLKDDMPSGSKVFALKNSSVIRIESVVDGHKAAIIDSHFNIGNNFLKKVQSVSELNISKIINHNREIEQKLTMYRNLLNEIEVSCGIVNQKPEQTDFSSPECKMDSRILIYWMIELNEEKGINKTGIDIRKNYFEKYRPRWEKEPELVEAKFSAGDSILYLSLSVILNLFLSLGIFSIIKFFQLKRNARLQSGE